MGREGVAYTFVTTEEGGELTRIEMLINRLLKRDEIEGFTAVATRRASAPAVGARDAASDGTKEADAEPEPPAATQAHRRPAAAHPSGIEAGTMIRDDRPDAVPRYVEVLALARASTAVTLSFPPASSASLIN